MLDGGLLRAPLLDQGHEAAVEGAEALGQRLVGIGGDDAVGQVAEAAARALHQAPAGMLQAGVEAQEADRAGQGAGQAESRCDTASDTSKLA
jgi:hypothetical protein